MNIDIFFGTILRSFSIIIIIVILKEGFWKNIYLKIRKTGEREMGRSIYMAQDWPWLIIVENWWWVTEGLLY